MNSDELDLPDHIARAVVHQVDPLQLHLNPEHWGTETPHPQAGGGES